MAGRARRKSPVTASRKRAYGKLRDTKRMSTTKAAKIANKGKTFEGRSEMAKKGWRTRKRRGTA